MDAGRPLVSLLLITYNQQDTVGEALAGALAQTYGPLEILAADDASSDGTWERMQAAVAGYGGPHAVQLIRNERNVGIGANLSRLAARARGELLVIAAGDDVSMPQRCERVVQAWLDHGRRPDLIATGLIDIDAQGHTHDPIVPDDLQNWRTPADWAARQPYVIGAAQAWTKRLFDRFEPLPEGTVAEDLLMVFRAIGSGGALTLREPLVHYRRGGVSRRVRNLHARDVVRRLLANNRHALIEAEQLLRDAQRIGCLDEVGPTLRAMLERERFVAALFAADGLREQVRAVRQASGVKLRLRLRLFVYAAMPWLLAPLFALKRAVTRNSP